MSLPAHRTNLYYGQRKANHEPSDPRVRGQDTSPKKESMMGITILIGDKVSAEPDEEIVQTIALPDAPAFPGDDTTGASNRRQMSYSEFQTFCKATGLTRGLYRPVRDAHPGAIEITADLISHVERALQTYEARNPLPPGFGAHHDVHLARLRWFHWWMVRAWHHCQHPVVANW